MIKTSGCPSDIEKAAKTRKFIFLFKSNIYEQKKKSCSPFPSIKLSIKCIRFHVQVVQSIELLSHQAPSC